MDCKQAILAELDNRLTKLNEHKTDHKSVHGNLDNQFVELNHAVSGIIGSAVTKEISSLKDFVQGL